MKRNAILRIIIWSLVLILLTGILGSALVYNTFRTRKFSAATQQAVALQPGEAQSAAAVPLEKLFTFPADEISELDIEWVAGNITIYPTDRQDITISEAGSTQDKYNMVWDSRNGKLSIKYCDESIISGIGMGIHADLSKDLYIYVPKGWICGSLELDMASADLKMHDMVIRELDIDGASGICDIRDCEIGDFDIDTASGDVNFTGSLDALDFDAASASFTGEFQNTPSRIDMDSMSGKLDIALPEDCGYSLTMAGMSSTFRSDFQVTSVKNNAHVYGDGRCRINVDGMSCDVTIRKLDATVE